VNLLRTTSIGLLLGLSALVDNALAKSLSLGFVGDIMLDGRPGATIASGEDPLAAAAATLKQYDLTVGNLECAIARGGHALNKPYTFRAAPEVLPTLLLHFSAVSIANNHSGDFGQDAFAETITHLTHAGLPFFGGGLNLRQAHRARVLVKNGVKLALLGYDEFLPRRFEAGPTTPGVAWSEDEQVVFDIRTARAEGADLVIPFMHWGWEYEHTPVERQQRLARLMIDAGADAVIGAHPHVTQTVELYQGKLIVYSLGNFVFDGFTAEDTTTGWSIGLEFNDRQLTKWHTTVFRMNTEGGPVPAPAAVSPCGDATRIQSCRAGKPLPFGK
jgi:poly-gamma-glutamate capsule biosynthesis protein CapA/YwtB (metallophosphatase superfamily)